MADVVSSISVILKIHCQTVILKKIIGISVFNTNKCFVIFVKISYMKPGKNQFNEIVETMYNLPLEDRVELMTLLEHNIADSRRDEIALSFQKAKKEEKSGKLKFSSSIQELKKMI